MLRASSYSNLVRLIKWGKLLFVTGTPMASSLKDVLSPLTRIRHTDPLILAFQGLCRPPVRTFIGYLPSLFHNDYNPTIEINEIEGNQPCRGIYHDTFLEVVQTGKADTGIVADLELNDALVHWKAVHYTSGNAVKPGLLSAHILRAGAGLLGWGVDFGAQVIKPILNNFYTRRTMRTGVEMPDGKTVYPAQDILPYTINVREVEYREDDPIGKQLAELAMHYADKLFEFDTAEIPEVTITGTPAGETSKDNCEVMMYFGVH